MTVTTDHCAIGEPAGHFTAEQEAFRTSLWALLDDSRPVAERLVADLTHDAELWKGLCRDGLVGLTVPEELGGSGGTFKDLMVVVEEMGRRTTSSPFFATACLGVATIMEATSQAQQETFLPSFLNTGATATLAFEESGGPWSAGDVQTVCRQAGQAATLSGRKTAVLDGASARHLLVVARHPGTHGSDGLMLVHVDSTAPGLEIRSLETLDPTRGLAEIEFMDTPGSMMDSAGIDLNRALRRVVELATVALCCEMMAGAAETLAMSVEHVRLREQFGRPIGAFQAVKHRCADMLLAVESGKALAYEAVQAVEQGDAAELAVRAAVAKAYCSDAFPACAAANLQNHGGIGFTWEHAAHVYLRRSAVSRAWLGDAVEQRSRLVGLVAASARSVVEQRRMR
jgi:alkylation response protein AidB-like acyl-CoA dehydrogenase